ncbi:MAG TPA: serine kinase [Dyella sp.]|uniref:serine kinase n=1 Tax=Dyella sp. TaxID=1869338 RepID=UPI002D120C17|nr:serine kinase [Dyella sp.]HUB90186.1 serine kinase [Dyella sp.]
MTTHPQSAVSELCADPFGEGFTRALSVHKQLLGARFHFESSSHVLLDLVEAAYGDVPPHHLPCVAPELHIQLRLVPGGHLPKGDEPPPVQMQSGMGWLCGVMDAANYVVISPRQRQALIVVSEDMLAFPYHLRYELIEFAVFVLAARCLGLVPLHGACVGKDGRGVLLLGNSGAGKTTLALHGLLHGLSFLAEDALFVQPESMLATAVTNYVHVKSDALRLIDDPGARRWISESPVIRRRSGVEKFEADVRRSHGQLAASPLKLVGAVFVCAERADDPAALLRPVPRHAIAARLQQDQPYAAGQGGWLLFQQALVEMGMYELRRGAHLRASVEAVSRLLDGARGEGCRDV